MSKGVYCLVLNLEKEMKLKIGRRLFSLPQGFYCYVGSALNNLEKRIERHLSKKKKRHWDIDHLTEKASVVHFKKLPTDKKIECMVSDRIKKLADDMIHGFGASDCKCKSHLHYFRESPLFRKDFHEVFEEMKSDKT